MFAVSVSVYMCACMLCNNISCMCLMAPECELEVCCTYRSCINFHLNERPMFLYVVPHQSLN